MIVRINCQLIIKVKYQFLEIRDCSKEIGEEPGGVIDFSNFELATTDDTHTYMNGTAIFKAEITSPCKGSIKSEKFNRGQWNIEALNRNVEDVCTRLWDPMSPLFPYFYDQPRCPIKIGVNFINFQFLEFL